MQAEADDIENEAELAGPYAGTEERDHALHLGMWVFLGSESLLFAGLIALYCTYRVQYPEGFARAARHNEQLIGSVNTLVLIVSSFFVAWAVHCMRGARPRASLGALAGTMGLGGVFLGLKSLEYAHHLRQGIAPGRYYTFAELPEHGAQLFFTLYYFLTALHALHVIAGMSLIAWVCLRIARRRTTPASHAELELVGLYWHLVDIVWIFLWPILYLVD